MKNNIGFTCEGFQTKSSVFDQHTRRTVARNGCGFFVSFLGNTKDDYQVNHWLPTSRLR